MTKQTIDHRPRGAGVALALIGVLAGSLCPAADVHWDGSESSDWWDGLNWDIGAGPAEGDKVFIHSGTVEFSTGDQANLRVLRLLGGTLTFSGGIFDCAYNPSWDSHVEGTLNHTGTTAKINELEVGRTSGDNGSYSLSGGSLRISRGINGYSLYLGGNKSGVNAGTGTMEISGGSLITRDAVKLGDSTLTGTGHFAVLGSVCSQIGIAASTGDKDGNWDQHSGSTLTVGIDYGGVTTIFLHDSGDDTTGTSATFESGTLLDVDYHDGATGGGTWTVMEVENGNITDNGLALAPGVDTGIWSFAVDNSGANGKLTVTAQGDPVIGGESFLIQGEDRVDQTGTGLENCDDEGGGLNVSHISDGDWCKFENIALGSDARLDFRVARPDSTDDGQIEVRLDATDGTLIGLVDVPVTGGWQTWETVSTTIPAIDGVHDIHLVFVETGTANGGSLFNLNWWAREEGPVRVEAEGWAAQSGVRLQDTEDIGGGQNIGWIDDGDWSEYSIDVETAGLHKLEFRVASDNGDGVINLMSGGTTLGSVEVVGTGGWQSWTTVSTYVNFVTTGPQTLRLDYALTGGGFNVNWFSHGPADDLIPLAVGDTRKQMMRYGLDYERLWYWTSSMNASEKDTVAKWSVVDCDVDYIRVAINCGYELTEGNYDESAYTSRIKPMMQDMKDANPEIKFFASPRPLNEAQSGARWQPYPKWITGDTGSSFSFDEVKCAEYLVRYLLLMKSYGFRISYMDLSNEWNYVTATDVRDISAYFDNYLDNPWPHPALDPALLLEEDDIPLLVAPSAWSYSQGSSWLNGVTSTLRRNAIDIASCHNTNKTGTAQDFADKVADKLNPGTEIWSSELHGWKSTSGANEVTTSSYLWEAIRAGFSGINGWLAIGTTNQGHCYILNPTGNPSRNVKYFIFKKLATTSNYGHALDVNQPAEFKSTAALIRGNLMTVWVNNDSTSILPVTIDPTGRTISGTTVKRTTWSESLDVAGISEHLPVTSSTSCWSMIPGESLCCFEIMLDPEGPQFTRIEVEDFDEKSGMFTEPSGDTGGTDNLGGIAHGDWCRFDDVTLGPDSVMRFRVARPAGRRDGWIEARLGGPTGTLIGKVAVPETGAWQTYETIEARVDPVVGTHSIYLRFVEVGSTAGSALFNLNWFSVTTPVAPGGLAGAAASATQVDLTWDAVAGAAGYVVKRATSSGGPYSVVANNLASPGFSDGGVVAGSQYFYVVGTLYDGLESGDSAPVSAVPSDPVVEGEVYITSGTIGSDGFGGEVFLFTYPESRPGHNHQVQWSETLDPADWDDVGDVVPGNGGALPFQVPILPGQARCYYRVAVWRQ